MRARGRLGYSAAEIIVVLTIVGVVLSIAVPRIQLALDRMGVHQAAREVIATIDAARMLSLAARAAVAVDVSSGDGVLRVRRDTEIVLTRNVGSAHQVQLTATRDSLAYDAYGLGHGAANLSIVVRRGSAAETVFVSRLGRVR